MKALLLAAVTAVTIIAAVEITFRQTGGVSNVPHGSTPIEFQWKLRHVQQERLTYFIGDSRVEWGFPEDTFNAECARHGACNLRGVSAAGPGSSAGAILRYVLDNHQGPPGTLVLNYSPCSFYRFVEDPGPAKADLKLQDYLDDRLTTTLQEYLFTYGRRPSVTAKHFLSVLREGPVQDVIFFNRGYVSGVRRLDGRFNDGTPFDMRTYQLLAYRKMFSFMRNESHLHAKRREELVSLVGRARAQGWRILLIRIPIGDTLYAMEAALPEDVHLEYTARVLDIPLLDYQHDVRTQHLQTLDDSHLTPQSAQEMARILAEDLAQVLPADDLAAAVDAVNARRQFHAADSFQAAAGPTEQEKAP